MRNLDNELVGIVLREIIDSKEVKSIRDNSDKLGITDTKIRDIYNYLRNQNIIYSVYRRGYFINDLYWQIFYCSNIFFFEKMENNFNKWILSENIVIYINRYFIQESFRPKDSKELVLKLIDIDLDLTKYKRYRIYGGILYIDRLEYLNGNLISRISVRTRGDIQWYL